MYIVIFFNSTMLFIFLLLVVALGVKVVSAVNGIVAVLAIILFIVETIILVGSNLSLIFRRENRTIGGIFKLLLSLISSALCIYISYIFMKDMQGYTDDFWSLVEFVLAVLFGSAICLCQLTGACALIQWVYSDYPGIDGELIKSVLMQVGSAALLFWLCGS